MQAHGKKNVELHRQTQDALQVPGVCAPRPRHALPSTLSALAALWQRNTLRQQLADQRAGERFLHEQHQQRFLHEQHQQEAQRASERFLAAAVQGERHQSTLTSMLAGATSFEAS